MKFHAIHNDHDMPYPLIKWALKLIISEADSGQDLVEFPYIIGYSNLVEVEETDEFYEEMRGRRPYPSRFVKR